MINKTKKAVPDIEFEGNDKWVLAETKLQLPTSRSIHFLRFDGDFRIYGVSRNAAEKLKKEYICCKVNSSLD